MVFVIWIFLKKYIYTNNPILPILLFFVHLLLSLIKDMFLVFFSSELQKKLLRFLDLRLEIEINQGI